MENIYYTSSLSVLFGLKTKIDKPYYALLNIDR